MNSQKRAVWATSGILAAGAYLGWRLARRIGHRGKLVFISGGSRGLGLALARRLGKGGSRLVLAARDAAELARAKADLEQRGVQVTTVVCDVTDPNSVDAAFSRVEAQVGTVDVVVNCAGVIQVTAFDLSNRADFEQAMAVNFWGTYNVVERALPSMRARRAGQIVNVASIGGVVAVPHLLPYSVSKFAVRGFSEGLRAELADKGVSVTTVLPGLVRTGSARQVEFRGDPEREYRWFSRADSMALTSVSADAAAAQIVRALRARKAEIVIGWQASALRVAHGLFPGTVTNVLGAINRLLPHALLLTSRSERGSQIDPKSEVHPALRLNASDLNQNPT